MDSGWSPLNLSQKSHKRWLVHALEQLNVDNVTSPVIVMLCPAVRQHYAFEWLASCVYWR